MTDIRGTLVVFDVFCVYVDFLVADDAAFTGVGAFSIWIDTDVCVGDVEASAAPEAVIVCSAAPWFTACWFVACFAEQSGCVFVSGHLV